MRIKGIHRIGQKFSRWEITGIKSNRHFWCKCDCGTVRPVDRSALLSGNTRSCGCLTKEVMRELRTTHGHSVGNETPEYRSWTRMRSRCNNPNSTQYKWYGGRGIKIYKEWDDFSKFLRDVGPCPGKGYTLERKDGNDDYRPGNVRWATKREQANNRSNTLLLTLNGETLPVSIWADRIGIDYKTLHCRKDMGWTDHDILTRPLRITSRSSILRAGRTSAK